MGGISKYQQAFFVPEFSKQHPQFADHVYRLKTLTLDQVLNCDPVVSLEVFAPFQTDPWAYPASHTMGTQSYLGVKRPGCGVGHLPPSSAEVKGRVELYLYSPFGPS